MANNTVLRGGYSSPESDSDIDTDSDSDNDGAKSDSSVIDDVVSTDGAEVHHISDATPKNTPLRLRDGPTNKNSWMTDGGFNMVKQKNRVIVNSNYNVSHPGQSAPKLRTSDLVHVITSHNTVVAVALVEATTTTDGVIYL